MSVIRVNARLDTSLHGPPHLFSDARAGADSLVAIHSAGVKCHLLVNRSCVHKSFYVLLQVKLKSIRN
jgi:hypothetical protein